MAALVLLTHCGGMEAEERPQEAPGPRLPAVLKQEVTTTLSYGASADARVEAASPERNFGGESKLGADLSPEAETYLRFNISGVSGSVTRARLRLYATDGTSDGPRVFRASGGWTEGGVTWNSRPAPSGAALDDKGSITSGAWVDFDVTGAVSGNGSFAFALVGTSGNGTDFASREDSRTDLRPQLLLTVESAPDCMPRTDTYATSFAVSRDAYVNQSRPTSVFENAPVMLVDASPARLESYLQFSFDVPEGWRVSEARMSLYSVDYTSDGPALYRVTDAWPGSGFDWYTRPSVVTGPLANAGTIAANSWVEYDVSSVVTGEGTYTFGLFPESTNGVDFLSLESSDVAHYPSLYVTLESEPYCTYRGSGGGLTGWTRHYGGAGPEKLHALASDSTGGFVAAGRFGAAPFPSSTGFALARYTADGTPLWTRQVTTEDVRVKALTVTPEGNLLVVGGYGGSPDLGSGPLTAAPLSSGNSFFRAFFIAKFSPTGEPVWSRGFVASFDFGNGPEPLPSSVETVTTDAQGSLIFGGGFHGYLNLSGGFQFAGPASIDYTGGSAVNGGFVAKYSWDGQPLWSRVFTAGEPSTDTTVRTVATDSSGNILVGVDARVGTFLPDGPQGTTHPLIMKYSPDARPLWRREFEGTHGSIFGVRPLGSDAVAFIAELVLTFTFDGRTYTGGDNTDLPHGGNPSTYLGTLSASGADGWLRPILTPNSADAVRGLVTGDDGTITLSGDTDELDLGGGILGLDDVTVGLPFVARYSAAGDHLWSRLFDDAFQGESFFPWTRLHLAPQPGGSLVVGSDFFAPVRLDGRTYTSRGATDLLYFQLRP